MSQSRTPNQKESLCDFMYTELKSTYGLIQKCACKIDLFGICVCLYTVSMSTTHGLNSEMGHPFDRLERKAVYELAASCTSVFSHF